MEKDLQEIENLLEKKTVRSEFLESHYSTKISNRDQYNLKDFQGRRLSHYWKNGDTILSVTWKKFTIGVLTFLNPDTYSMENYYKLKKKIQTLDKYAYFIYAALSVPALIYIPLILPRVKKVKKDYILNQYLKKKYYEEELKTGRRNIKLRDMKKILEKVNES